jgi:hypothetical protein
MNHSCEALDKLAIFDVITQIEPAVRCASKRVKGSRHHLNVLASKPPTTKSKNPAMCSRIPSSIPRGRI